jgi:hypothetical protein
MNNNKLPTFFLFLAILFFSYIIYLSEIKWDGTRGSYYLQYYIVSIIFILFSVISFYINKKIRQNFTIFFIATISSLYFIEVLFYFTNYKPIHSELKKHKEIYYSKTGNEYDLRTKHQVYKDLKKKNSNIVPSIPPKKYFQDLDAEFLPLTGVSNSKTIYCNENGYWSIYDSDRYGFNNPDEYWNKENLDFILLGDSFAKGACVNRPNDITSKLRKKNLNGVNFAHGGYGPLIQLAALKEYSAHFKKFENIIFFFYEGNDLANLNYSLKYTLLRRYIDDEEFNQNLINKQDQIDQLAKKIIFKLKLKRFNEFFKLTNVRNLINIKKINYNEFKPIFTNNIDSCSNSSVCIVAKEIDKNFKKTIMAAKKFSNKNNSNFYFVYLPEYWRYNSFNYPDKTRLSIKKFLKENNIILIDLHEELFLKAKEPLNLFAFNSNRHYNEDGYNKISNTIFKNIFDN